MKKLLALVGLAVLATVVAAVLKTRQEDPPVLLAEPATAPPEEFEDVELDDSDDGDDTNDEPDPAPVGS
jgi:hypothetical protein